jgi:hypothetical protein
MSSRTHWIGVSTTSILGEMKKTNMMSEESCLYCALSLVDNGHALSEIREGMRDSEDGLALILLCTDTPERTSISFSYIYGTISLLLTSNDSTVSFSRLREGSVENKRL